MNHINQFAAAARHEDLTALIYGSRRISHSSSPLEADAHTIKQQEFNGAQLTELQDDFPLAVNLRLPMVIFLTGLSRSSIYDRMNSNSPRHDPTFPKPHRLNSCGRSAVAWYAHEIQAWIMGRGKKNHQ